MPRTRPASPDPSNSRKPSLSTRRTHRLSGIPPTSSNPTSPQISRRIFPSVGTRGLSNLCMFEDGLQHYERVRSSSLRGHSRRGSLIHTASDISNDQLSSQIFELDLSEDLAEETFRQPRWSDDEDDVDSEGDGEGDESRDLFKVGDRVGVGTLHQGYRVRDLFEMGAGGGRRVSNGAAEDCLTSGILEIVRQIGVGSYAVVYLVREVLFDPDFEAGSSSQVDLSQTPKASDGFVSLTAYDNIASARRRDSTEVVYGRDFALKCLCKRNLSEELLVLQRGEAELHRSLPLHHNIVALHRALETPNWLFLVIEYCPGQDLFYWLEQARDSQDLESLASRTNSCAPHLPGCTQLEALPIDTILSGQIGQTVSTTAVLNTPPSPSLLASTADDEMLSRRRLRLISKMFVQMCDAVEACHQAGVCHRDIKPENFIVVDYRKSTASDSWKSASSDPPVETRSSVIVKITDWGLGTSSKACEDFDCGSKPYMAYECRNNLTPTYDPVQADVWSLGIVLLNLLYHRCPWADPSPSDPDFREFRRAPVAFLRGRFEGMTQSVAEFLADHVFCEVDCSQRRITAGKFGEWVKDLLHHMGGGQPHASVSDATIAISPSSARGGIDQRRSTRGSSLGGLSKRSSQLFQSISLPDPVPEVSSPIDRLEPVISQNVPEVVTQHLISWSEKPCEFEDLSEQPTEILADKVLDPEVTICSPEVNGHDDESVTSGSKVGSDKPKRRKRGARKGRKVTGRPSPYESESFSPTSSTEVDMLDGLAEASQSLAREISQASKISKPLDDRGTSFATTKRKLNIAERMMEKFRDGSNPDLQAFVARARAREAAYMGKVSSNTASAPAQLQDINRPGQNYPISRSTMSTASCSKTAPTMSSSSAISWGPNSDGSSFSKSPTHWSSASHRRDRIQKTNPPGATTTLASRREASSSTAVSNDVHPHHHPKKEESKNKLAQLLTSFKRFNSTVGNHQSSSASPPTTTSATATNATTAIASSTIDPDDRSLLSKS